MDRCSTVRPMTLNVPQPSMICCVVLVVLIVIVTSPLLLVGWASMLANCVALFLMLKHLVWMASPHASRTGNFNERVAFYLLWPGMDVAAFVTNRHRPTRRPAGVVWGAAMAKTLLAVICVGLLIPFLNREYTVAVGVAGMLAGVLFFHSGLFHLLALMWQCAGRDIRPIMNAPLAATSLADFWGRRWNLAFRDAAALLVFRPTARRWGVAAATLITFFVSGLLHDAVISLPARGGYGLPTLYFLLQYVGMMFERAVFRNEMSFWKRVANRATTALVIVLPLPLLFHRPFADNVILPLPEMFKRL